VIYIDNNNYKFIGLKHGEVIKIIDREERLFDALGVTRLMNSSQPD
jgi:hypothetical protein